MYRTMLLLCITIVLMITACSDNPTSDKAPTIFSGLVVTAEHEESNDFIMFYEIAWEYSSTTHELSFSGRLRQTNEAVEMQGISLYLTGDGEPLGDGSGFLSFLDPQDDGTWTSSEIMTWWITVEVERKPELIEIFCDLKIWLDADGEQQTSQETEKLGEFVLE